MQKPRCRCGEPWPSCSNDCAWVDRRRPVQWGVEFARWNCDCRLPGTRGATEWRPGFCEPVPAHTRVCAYDRSSHKSSSKPDRRMTQRRPDSVVTVLQISDTHLHATADSRMRGVTTYATLLSVLDHVRRDRRWPADIVLATGDIVQDESRAGYERFRRDAGAARRARAVDPRQSRRPEAHGRDLEQRLVSVRRRAATRAVVDRATQHVPRGRRRGRARARALAGPSQGARRARRSARTGRHASSSVADGQHVARRRRAARRGGFLADHRCSP